MEKNKQINITMGNKNLKENINYNLAMQKQIANVLSIGKKPNLLLHSCCAPCSSYVLRLLQKYFNITVFFYNPNLYPREEYFLRESEQKQLIKILNAECEQAFEKGEYKNTVFRPTPIKIETLEFVPQEYYDYIKGYETGLEGSPRCYLCYMLRLLKTAEFAKQNQFDYFCTTLTVSPYKNARWINQIGENLSKKMEVKFLNSDFKKNDGYKKSIEYSKEYGLYRQDYCGCEFSMPKRMEKVD